jgi:hypothetical protein
MVAKLFAVIKPAFKDHCYQKQFAGEPLSAGKLPLSSEPLVVNGLFLIMQNMYHISNSS